MGKKMGLFLVIALLFLCSGCVPSVELNERAIVQLKADIVFPCKFFLPAEETVRLKLMPVSKMQK